MAPKNAIIGQVFNHQLSEPNRQEYMMNAIDFLLKEHDKFRATFKQIAEAPFDNERMKKFAELCRELINHETIEHKLWYPHFKNIKPLNVIVNHLLLEETRTEHEIQHFENIHYEDTWEKKFATLKKDIEHHADEEENKLFPEVSKLLSNNDLEKIGKEMQQW